ncbi:hypothetical protein DB313_06205 (plasmid) [Borrelia turcica IST7]|uniref:DUF2634 domain-containing protein n=1 Tax=Borrelia turcica IST7 TaxID=1104446 RepID=A0A386PPN5_9SPIR|nr:hypothetical protein [Borrelia turcica]AYE37092.1 hypothetical protein DB313_06205 [Borrelia turcica IST7]
MDLKIDGNFDLVFGSDLHLVDGVAEQKQKLAIFLKTIKGSLLYAPNYGFDYSLCLRACKLNRLDFIKSYFLSIAQELKLDLINVKATLIEKEGGIRVFFYFIGDNMSMDFAI